MQHKETECVNAHVPSTKRTRVRKNALKKDGKTTNIFCYEFHIKPFFPHREKPFF